MKWVQNRNCEHKSPPSFLLLSMTTDRCISTLFSLPVWPSAIPGHFGPYVFHNPKIFAIMVKHCILVVYTESHALQKKYCCSHICHMSRKTRKVYLFSAFTFPPVYVETWSNCWHLWLLNCAVLSCSSVMVSSGSDCCSYNGLVLHRITYSVQLIHQRRRVTSYPAFFFIYLFRSFGYSLKLRKPVPYLGRPRLAQHGISEKYYVQMIHNHGCIFWSWQSWPKWQHISYNHATLITTALHPEHRATTTAEDSAPSQTAQSRRNGRLAKLFLLHTSPTES